jgi:hypothetical protein
MNSRPVILPVKSVHVHGQAHLPAQLIGEDVKRRFEDARDGRRRPRLLPHQLDQPYTDFPALPPFEERIPCLKLPG